MNRDTRKAAREGAANAAAANAASAAPSSVASAPIQPAAPTNGSITTMGQLLAEEERLEEELSGAGDDAQLANVDLQSALQQLQQILQTLSNVMKSDGDNKQAVNRNLVS